MQRLVNASPDILLQALGNIEPPMQSGPFRWVSPLPGDEWAEYRDRSFLERIGQQDLGHQLANFWPSRGPQWDGLGVYPNGSVVLVEAKAHVAELLSRCSAGAKSRARIDLALQETAQDLGTEVTRAWTARYYQYANRLAHLMFLRKTSVRAAWLLMVYFTGDDDIGGPMSKAEWQEALATMYESLGLRRLPEGVVNVFLDVKRLS
jgi:hypothetical protein